MPEKAESGLEGWVDCFAKAKFKDSLFLGGLGDPGQAAGNDDYLKEAYEFGKNIK